MNLFEFLRENFFHVLPILIAGALAVAITFERVRALLLLYPLQAQANFYERLRDLVMSDRIAEAIALCDHYPKKVVPKVVREGLLRAHQPESMIMDGLELAVNEVTQTIQKRTPFLATIANISTLLGLFGTILGLIQSFSAVGSANAQERSALLAAGISTAMNATMMGLAVAIPCMIAFSFLQNRTNRLNSEVEQAAARILDIIKQRYYAVELDATPSIKRAA